MTLDESISLFFKRINKDLNSNKYNREELNKSWKLLKVESAYIQYYIKTKLGANGEQILIDNHRKIISDYIRIFENIEQRIINKQPEIFYLILSYLRIIEKDNKILLKSNSKFISIYINYIKNKKLLHTPLNIITLSMEVADNLNTKFRCNIYNNDNEFKYINDIITIVLKQYEDYQSSRENSSDSDNGFITDDNQKIDDNNKSSSSSNSSSSPSISSRCCDNDYCNENCNCDEPVEFCNITDNNATNNITEI